MHLREYVYSMQRRVEGDPSEQVCDIASTGSDTCLAIVHHQPPLHHHVHLAQRSGAVCGFVRFCRDRSLVYEFEDVSCLFVGKQ